MHRSRTVAAQEGRLTDQDLHRMLRRQVQFKREVDNTRTLFHRVSLERQTIANKTQKSLHNQYNRVGLMLRNEDASKCK